MEGMERDGRERTNFSDPPIHVVLPKITDRNSVRTRCGPNLITA